MSYVWNRLGTWCIQFLEYLIYVFYHLEWYSRHCGSHNDMFSICFKSLLRSQNLSHAFICLNCSQHHKSCSWWSVLLICCRYTMYLQHMILNIGRSCTKKSVWRDRNHSVPGGPYYVIRPEGEGACAHRVGRGRTRAREGVRVRRVRRECRRASGVTTCGTRGACACRVR